MPLHNPTDAKLPLVGTITVELYLTADGVKPAYGFEGVDKSAAIGHLITVTDRLRKEREYEWSTCPGCHLPWAAHDDPDWEPDDDDVDEDEELGHG